MRVKLSGIGPETTFRAHVDAYAPFEVELAPDTKSSDELFYWRSTGSKYLLEIKIIARTGMLGAISLVLVPREWTRVVDSVHARQLVTSTKGLPIVDLSPWKEKIGNRKIGIDPALRRVDEKDPFVFEIGRDGLAVFFESGTATSTVSNQGLTFLFTDDETLCNITLAGLSTADLQLLQESYAL
jgi:hypothetical protein